MERPSEPLNAALIEVPGVEVRVVGRCTSTNSLLLAEKSAARILLAAEEQTAGRGRHGRSWESAAGADVTFSLSCPVRRPPRELASLSLVAAVAAVKALRALGVGAASVKWPNDLLAGGAKLGGILVETRAEGGAARAVFGFGINCLRRPGLERRLRRPVAALEQFARLSRNRVIGAIARSLLAALERFEAEGFAGGSRTGARSRASARGSPPTARCAFLPAAARSRCTAAASFPRGSRDPRHRCGQLPRKVGLARWARLDERGHRVAD